MDVRDFPMEALRDRVALVQQKAELFSRSIGENIAWGAEGVEKDQIRQAAQIAQAEDFILRTPDGYDTQATPFPAGRSSGFALPGRY